MIVHVKFDALCMVSLHRQPPEVGLVKKVKWKFVVGGARCAIPI